MKTYQFKIYGTNWGIIAQGFLSAEDYQAAELEEERIADSYRDIGYDVKGSSLERVR